MDSSLAEDAGAWSGTVGKSREVGFALFLVGVTAFLCLLAAVEEEVSVVGELLDAGIAVLVGVGSSLSGAAARTVSGPASPCTSGRSPPRVRRAARSC